MKRLVLQVCVGESRPLWDRCMTSVAAYAGRIGVEYRRISEPILRIAPLHSRRSANALRLGYLPILEKANVVTLLGEYDQVAVLDADIYVTSEAPDIFASIHEGADFAGVVERTLPLSHRYLAKLDSYERGQYGPLKGVGLPFVNCGVEVWNSRARRLTGDDPVAFLRRPEFARFIDGEGAWRWSTEQTLKNWWLRSSGAILQRLHPRFNWLYGCVERGREAEGWFHHFLLSDHLPSQDPQRLLSGNHRVRV